MLKSYRKWNLSIFPLAISIGILCLLPVLYHSQGTANEPMLRQAELDLLLNPQALKSAPSRHSSLILAQIIARQAGC